MACLGKVRSFEPTNFKNVYIISKFMFAALVYTSKTNRISHTTRTKSELSWHIIKIMWLFLKFHSLSSSTQRKLQGLIYFADIMSLHYAKFNVKHGMNLIWKLVRYNYLITYRFIRFSKIIVKSMYQLHSCWRYIVIKKKAYSKS